MTKLNLTPTPEVTPTILGGSGKRAFDGIKVGLINIRGLDKYQSKEKFNQSELTFIRKMMLLAEEAIQEQKEELTILREKLWNACDKEDITTASTFKTLNQVKNDLKKIRKLKRTIVSVNQKVKKQTKELQ